MTPKKRKLSDIVKDVSALKAAWAGTTAAPDLKPIPNGRYICRLDDIQPDTSREEKPRLKITVTVTDGDYAGRKVWHDAYLTTPAMPFTMRLLSKVGLTDLEKIDEGVPSGIVIRAHIILKTRDDKTEYNEIRDWELVAVNTDPAPTAPAQPAASPPTAPAPWAVDLDNLDTDTPKGDGR